MARYKDCDQCYHKRVCAGDTDKWNYYGECLHFISIEDLAPQSEVDKWICRCGDWHGVAELKSRRIVELDAELASTKREMDILKSLIARKEEDAYNKGYGDAVKEILERFRAKMYSEIARNKLLAEYGDDFYEGRIDAFLTSIDSLAEIAMEYSGDARNEGIDV